MTENTIEYKGQWLTYSKVADELVLEHGCNKLEQLDKLLYLGAGRVMCESELSLIKDSYLFKVCSIRDTMSYYE